MLYGHVMQILVVLALLLCNQTVLVVARLFLNRQIITLAKFYCLIVGALSLASVQPVDTDDSQSPQNPSVMPMNKIKSDRPAKQIDKQEAALRVKRDFRLRLVVAFAPDSFFQSVVCPVCLFADTASQMSFRGRRPVIVLPYPYAPARGDIVDVNGVSLAGKLSCFSLEVIPSKVEGRMEDLIQALVHMWEISKTDLKRLRNFVLLTANLKISL